MEAFSVTSHHCAARVIGATVNVRNRVLPPPYYDDISIVELESGGREVDTEE